MYTFLCLFYKHRIIIQLPFMHELTKHNVLPKIERISDTARAISNLIVRSRFGKVSNSNTYNNLLNVWR